MIHTHAFFVGGVVGLGTAAALTLMMLFPGRSIFFGVLAGWILLLACVEWLGIRIHGHRNERFVGTPIFFVTLAAAIGMVAVVEWPPLSWFLAALFSGIMAVLAFLDHGDHVSRLSFERKPMRRIVSMIWIWNAYAIMTALFGVRLFFPSVLFSIVWAGMVVVLLFAACMIWRLYYQITYRAVLLWLLILAIVVAEFIWVVHVLPFGYFVSGFLVVWLWYLCQLFIRFSLSERGIMWKKQYPFLLTNAILFILFLLFTRWI